MFEDSGTSVKIQLFGLWEESVTCWSTIKKIKMKLEMKLLHNKSQISLE